jgi:hypothetical protein
MIQVVPVRMSRREDDRFDTNRFNFDGQVFVLQDVSDHGVVSNVNNNAVVVVVVDSTLLSAAGFILFYYTEISNQIFIKSS